MDYLSFLKNKDKNRRRKKNMVIYGLYLLIPIFLIASTFTNERIITKCEDIYHEKVVYEQLVVEKEGQLQHLAQVCSTRVDSLSRLLGISAGDFMTVTGNLKKTKSSNEKLLSRIAELEAALADAEGRIRELEGLVEQLRAEITELSAHIRQLDEDNTRKDAKITELENQLAACEANYRETLQQLKNCQDEYKDLRRRNSSLQNENGQLRQELERYKRLYNAEVAKNKSLQEQYDDLKNRYDRLARAKPKVSIESVDNPRGINPFRIERNQVYKVTVNGRVVKYIKANPCVR